MDETPVSLASLDSVTLRAINSVQDCSLSQDVTRRMELKLQRPGSQVSNTDHLFRRDALIMILETSTSSLSFRSSELSQLSEVVSS